MNFGFKKLILEGRITNYTSFEGGRGKKKSKT
jgi:hypothetical protein